MLNFWLLAAASVLYSSVGHAGASGYLAVMALANVDPEVMKPAALVLNLVVTTIATARFSRAGHFSWPLFWPFAATSVPFAFLGGAMQLPGDGTSESLASSSCSLQRGCLQNGEHKTTANITSARRLSRR